MKKARKILSLAFAFITVMLASLFTACAKESTIYLTVKSDDGQLPPLAIAAIILAAVVIVAVIILLSISSKRKKAAEEAAAEENAVVLTQDPNAVSEYIFEDEKKAAEEQTEEQTEEKAEEETEETAKEATEEKTEEVAEETVEEAAEEKTEEVAEETVEEAAEEKTEEVPEETAEEAAEEKTEEIAEETVEETAEEVPEETVEEIVEEVADADFASETEEKSEITAEEIEEEPEYTIGANGLPVAPEGKVIRYKWSFLARLIQSDDELKYRYMMLRRKLLSYKKVRSNVSWNFDSYFIGRKPIVKLKVRGKTLVAYFPIDPQEMQGTKFVGEDFSGVSRYKAVPFAYRINGMRKLKYALELIEKQLEGIKSTDPKYIELSEANEAIPRESLKKLYDKGYVRVGGILAVGERASSKDDDEDDDEIVDVVENEVDEETAPSELREEFNFNPKASN